MYICHTRALAEAVGRNEMPFGRDSLVVPSSIVLEGATSLSSQTSKARLQSSKHAGAKQNLTQKAMSEHRGNRARGPIVVVKNLRYC